MKFEEAMVKLKEAVIVYEEAIKEDAENTGEDLTVTDFEWHIWRDVFVDMLEATEE